MFKNGDISPEHEANSYKWYINHSNSRLSDDEIIARENEEIKVKLLNDIHS